MGGTGANAILGFTPYVGFEVNPGVLLRPSLAGGAAVIGGTENEHAVWFAGRLDVCWRTPGTYPFNRGMQLDLCGGADAGATVFTEATLPELAIGPAVDLEGELGNDFAVAIRGVAGVNVLRGSFEDTSGATVKVPWFSGRLEVALLWRAR